MKNKYFILSAIALITVLLLTGCEKSGENAQEQVKKANQEMLDAQAQFNNEWQQFKSDAEMKISSNEKKIEEFKAAMKTTSKKFKTKYENTILTLEQKNIELQKKLNDYQYEGKENWVKFKQAFNNDMDSVGNVINDIFSKKD
jgi:outer membrane murein-binding lipoprotein Lpp